MYIDMGEWRPLNENGEVTRTKKNDCEVTRTTKNDPGIDGDGFQVVQRRKRKVHASRLSKFIQIEAKSFEMKEISKPNGRSLQITEQRSQLVPSILLPEAALPWLRQALDGLNLSRELNQGRIRSSWLSYQVLLLFNPKGRYIRVVDSSRWKNRLHLHPERFTLLRLVAFWTQHDPLLRIYDLLSYIKTQSRNQSPECLTSSTSTKP